MTRIEQVAVQARKIAAEAADRSGVRVEIVRELDGLQVVCDVVDWVWQPRNGESTMRIELLRALTHVGNYCVLAWDGAEPLGVCFGFLSVEPERELHSHIAAVTAAAAGRRVGRALKLDQRAWALEHSLPTIGWTFDPLIRRNAFFNACRLGALPTSYLIDFYGTMNDSINVGQTTDRVTVSWPLASQDVIAICAGRDVARPVEGLADRGAHVLLSAVGDRPVRHASSPQARTAMVQIPVDIEALRGADPGLARQWRTDVRETLGTLMTDGWRVTEFGRDGYYVLERDLITSEESA
jgi:predicted GNAT superfamily acetyltransferase